MENNQPPLPPPLPPRPVPPRKESKNQRPSPRRSRAIRRELSAGGVAVRRESDQWFVALLKTEHKRGAVWVLPKGHVELSANENIAEAARREVGEEAGLTDLAVKNELGVTRFKFQAETAVVHKTVHYFLMVTNQKTLTPQAEEGLLEAKWFPIDEAITALAYDTDQNIVARAREIITGQKPENQSSSFPKIRI